MDDLFVGRILWMYPVWRVERTEKGGCLTALERCDIYFHTHQWKRLCVRSGLHADVGKLSSVFN